MRRICWLSSEWFILSLILTLVREEAKLATLWRMDHFFTYPGEWGGLVGFPLEGGPFLYLPWWARRICWLSSGGWTISLLTLVSEWGGFVGFPLEDGPFLYLPWWVRRPSWLSSGGWTISLLTLVSEEDLLASLWRMDHFFTYPGERGGFVGFPLEGGCLLGKPWLRGHKRGHWTRSICVHI